jgi:diadenosine tetraphosphatase ApaH/serine/threonine PP2A family protein phosphatase
MLDAYEPTAVLSDAHGNLEALQAVLTDARAFGAKKIINLGDSVGYGPNPRECIDLLEAACAVNLCGNHDYATLNQPDNFNQAARKSIIFVREKLHPDQNGGEPDTLRRWRFLKNLLPLYEQGDFEFMHGSPRRPITEYVLPSDPRYDPFKIDDIFAALGHRFAFVGHTHYPGVIEEHGETFMHPAELRDMTYWLTGRRAIINVGSVGQPRDSDCRACYAILRDGQIIWRRVAYSVIATVEKIRAQKLLDDQLGARLIAGQ